MAINDETDVRLWFAEYIEVLTACFRGDRDAAALLGYFGVPLHMTTDDGLVALTTEDEVVGLMRAQAEALQAAGYHQTDVVDSEVTLLNASSALYRVALVRRREDGSEVGRLNATYLLADGAAGRRFAAVAMQVPA